MEKDDIELTQEQFNLPGSFVNSVKYTLNGRYYAIITDSKALTIFDAQHNTTKVTFISEPNYVKDVAFSSDSISMAAAINDQIIIYEVPTTRNFGHLEIPDSRNEGRNECFIRLCFGSNNLHIAAATADRIYVISDFRDKGLPIYNFFEVNFFPIKSLQYFKYNNSILSTGAQNDCVKWNALSTQVPDKNQIPNVFTKITHSVISPDDRYILLTHLKNFLSSWEVKSNNIFESNPSTDTITHYRIYYGHKSDNENLMGNIWYTGMKKLVLAGSKNGVVFIWNFESGVLLTTVNALSVNEEIIEGVKVNIEPQPDSNIKNMVIHIEPEQLGNKLFLLNEDGTLTMWRKKFYL